MSGEIHVFDIEDVENNKGLAALSIIPLLFLVYMFGGNKSEYARYCANQGIILTILYVVCSVLIKVFDKVALVGSFMVILLGIINLALIALIIYQVYSAYKGMIKPLPIINDIEILK